MKLIGRYLSRNLVVAMVFITAGLSSTIWMTQSLRLIQLVVEGGAPISMFLRLAFSTLPTFLALVMPWGVLIATLFTYNRLTLDSELVVMRAAGMGPLTLARPALQLSAIVLFLCLLLNLFLAPAAQREFVRLREEIRTDYSSVLLREGTFNDVGEGKTVYVRQRGAEGMLNGLIIYDNSKPQRPVMTIADHGILVTAEAGPRVIVYDGVRQEYDRDTGHASNLEFKRYTVDLKVLNAGEAPRWPDPRERTLSDLLFDTGNPTDTQLRPRLNQELHQRFATPLLAPAFAMIALTALMSGEFSRRGQARRIALAVVFGMLLQAMMLGISNLAVKTQAFNAVLYVVGILPVAMGYWYLENWRRLSRGGAGRSGTPPAGPPATGSLGGKAA